MYSEVISSIWRQWIRIGCEGLTLSFENRNICTESFAISTLDSESTLDLSVLLSLGHSCCSYKVRFCSSKIHMDTQWFLFQWKSLQTIAVSTVSWFGWCFLCSPSISSFHWICLVVFVSMPLTFEGFKTAGSLNLLVPYIFVSLCT